MTGVIRTIDLFAGAGGLAQGFKQSGLGYEPVFAVEIDPAAARTFKQNFGCPVYDGPIEEVPDEDYPSADVIIGGPPCQGFSPLGRDRDVVSRAEINELWQQYLKVVRIVRPKAFVIENVYTATSDSAGSLGGIVAQVESGALAASVRRAIDRMSWCSADPLCIESDTSGTDNLNRAACHSCVLLPETSCEEFNTLLDRALLVGTPEDRTLGFFSRFNS